MDREILTMKEAADYLRVSRATMYKIIETGGLPAYKVNGTLRFEFREIRAYIERNRIKVG